MKNGVAVKQMRPYHFLEIFNFCDKGGNLSMFWCFSMLGKNSAAPFLEYFFLFFPRKIDFEIS